MPLKAVAGGETIIAPDLSDEEWEDLKLRHRKGLAVTMACCGAPGHLRVSGKGTRHFYHAADAGCRYEEESREHLEIKYQIYRTCRSENWETSAEYPAPDRTWVSDVYAKKAGRRVVFEVQISAISPDDLEERDRKYQDVGIESYWLLDNFMERSRDFPSWYHSRPDEDDDRPGETIPYIDPSLFETGPENHIFIARGIRSVGLDAGKQTLFTTNNPEIPLAVWVREVLKGNYRKYLEETAAACNRKRRLKAIAAPALIRFRQFYDKIVRDETYRKKADHWRRISGTGKTHMNMKALQQKSDEIYAEVDWLEKEYRSFMAESYGLFTWKKMPGQNTPRPYFRLESESKIRKLQECVKTLDRWEDSFNNALGRLEREFPAGKQ